MFAKNILAKVFSFKILRISFAKSPFHSFSAVIVTTHLFSIYFTLEKLIYTCRIGTEGQKNKTRDKNLHRIHEKEIKRSEVYVIYTLPLWVPPHLALENIKTC